MAKSHRARPVKLTKTRKLGMARKEALIMRIRESIDEFDNIVSFQVRNVRSTFMRQVRQHFQGKGRFFFGKNKLMQLALGREPETEYKAGLSVMASTLVGTCGLFFTDLPLDGVLEYFRSFTMDDFPRSGFVATHSVSLPGGELPCPPFEASMDSYCRNTLIMPTEVRSGKLCLVHEIDVCRKGQRLTPEAARILRLLGDKMSTFKFILTCTASRKSDDHDVYDCVALDTPDSDDEGEEAEGSEEGDDDEAMDE